jgi:hypothetical protein
MLNLITSYLIQAGECVLPGIGSFSLVSTPSSLDVANKEILPPVTEFRFSDTSGQPGEGLIQYIAFKKGTDNQKALDELKDFCAQLKTRIYSGEKIPLNSIGILLKDSYGNIVFEPENHPYFKSVPAIRVVHKEAKHAMIVGDKETDSSTMNEILNSESEIRSGNSFWKIAAIVLFLIGAGILIYHFYSSSSENPLGNSKKIIPQTKTETYISR